MVLTVYDVLPSPANLHVWGKSDSPACLLCPGRSSLKHVLSGRPKALGEIRYLWRRDQVLKTVAEAISSAVANNKQVCGQRNLTFVRAGEKPQSRAGSAGGLLTLASDWELRVDLGRQLKFPDHFMATSLRPDMVLSSVSLKQLLLMELTIPWDDRMEEANEQKRSKYQELVEQCRIRGWKACSDLIEVGCTGFAGRSLCKVYTRLGITGAARRRAINYRFDCREGFGLGGAIHGSVLLGGTQAGVSSTLIKT